MAEPLPYLPGLADGPGARLTDVRVLLADARAHIRNALKVALTHAGMEQISQTGALTHVVDMVAGSIGPDVLICDMEMDHGQACKLISAVRHNDLGRNPFICVIGLSWAPTSDRVSEVASAGVDHLLAAPVAPRVILDRIAAMIYRRVPFVVTADYVGPDRRLSGGRTTNIPLVEVPNSLRQKAIGTWNAEAFEREITREVRQLNTRKVDRQAESIMALADLIANQQGEGGPAVVRHLVLRLTRMVEEMDRRATERGIYHVAELCRACVEISETIRMSEGDPLRTDIELIKHLGRAIRIALYPKERNAELAYDIADAVATR